jgi:flavodoxin
MKRSVVAYFSPTGTTKRAALELAETVGADAVEIVPAKPYTQADLDWRDEGSRSTVEMRDKSSRPELAAETRAFDSKPYDVLFVGFPIWWYVAPTIVNTFLESVDTAGKTVVLFATSGGSRFGSTLGELKGSVDPSTRMVEGAILNDARTCRDFAEWARDMLEK